MLAGAPFAGRSDKVPRLSLTMALMEDSGWYLPRWEEVAPLDYGRDAGCSLLRQGAVAWAAAHPKQELFCPPGSSQGEGGG